MNDMLQHYGVKGMKWGVRRTPSQLGHISRTIKKTASAGLKKLKEVKSTKKSSGKASVLTDDELRKRIARLQMEETYSGLVEKQKERSTGKAKKLVDEAIENFGKRSLDKIVNMAINRIFDANKKKDSDFDIQSLKDKDVLQMDAETISKVAKWYTSAMTIEKGRENLNKSSKTSKSDEKDEKKEDK